MNIIGQGGVNAYTTERMVLLTPDERVVNIQAGPQSVASRNPLKDMYFFCYVDGTDVIVSPGLLVLETSQADSLGIDTPGFTISGLTSSTTGFVYYEALVDQDQVVDVSDSVSSAPPTDIGSSSYYFAYVAHAQGTELDTSFLGGAVFYATSRPAQAAGYYRKVLATVSVNSGGFPFNLKQEHIGVLHVSFAEIFSFENFGVAIA